MLEHRWYSKEFIHSSQTALRMVFNIGNLPPDSDGRESYVYVMTGDSVRNIKDLAIDDLTPWNSKSCKSSTRFNAIQVDGGENVFLRRHIVSEGGEPPDRLLACYYCKHPIFRLTKKIFYACDGRREHCLPGTFVIFIYEFETAEKLHSTRRFYSYSASKAVSAAKGASSSNSSSKDEAAAAATAGSSSSSNSTAGTGTSLLFSGRNIVGELQGDQNIRLEDLLVSQDTPLYLSHQQVGQGMDVADFDYGGFDYADEGISHTETVRTSGAAGLEDLLKYSESFGHPKRGAEQSLLEPQFMPNLAPMRKKRRKSSFPTSLAAAAASSFDRQDESLLDSPNTEATGDVCSKEAADGNSLFGGVAEEEEASPFRFFLAVDAMLENFRVNGLCDGALLADRQNALEEALSSDSSAERDLLAADEAGGCLVIDEPISVGRCMVTALWFQNPTFRLNGSPVVHPVALVLAIGQPQQQPADEIQYLLSELHTKIKTDTTARVCRALLMPECQMDGTEDFGGGLSGHLIDGPCVRLTWPDKFRLAVRHKCEQLGLAEDDVFRVDGDLFGSGEQQQEEQCGGGGRSGGILHALSFEEFIRRLRGAEKNWVRGFKTWFREKSGWIFERCSLGSWMKAGFSSLYDAQTTKHAISEARCTLRAKLELAVQETTISSTGGEFFENAVVALEEACEEMLNLTAQSLFLTTSSDLSTANGVMTLCPSKSGLAIARADWLALPPAEKRARLASLGLSSLRLMDPLDQRLFIVLVLGLSRAEKTAIRSQASTMEVIRLSSELLPHRYPPPAASSAADSDNGGEMPVGRTMDMDFTVVDLAHRQCFFVSLRHSSTVRSNPSSLVEDQLGQQEQGGGGEEEDENKNEIKRETTTTTSDNYCNNSENGASTKDSHQSQPRDELRRQMTSMVSCQCQDHQSTICCFCPHICAVATHCPQAGKLIADALAARHRKEEEGGGGVNQQNLDSLYSTAAATPQNDDNTNNEYAISNHERRSMKAGTSFAFSSASPSVVEIIRCSTTNNISHN